MPGFISLAVGRWGARSARGGWVAALGMRIAAEWGFGSACERHAGPFFMFRGDCVKTGAREIGRKCVVVLCSAGFAACGVDHRPPEGTALLLPPQADGWKDDLEIAEFEDLDRDPSIVEVELTAALGLVELEPGLTTEMWTYNGVVPGPLLRAKKGDRVIIHFTNHLPEETTVHFHGVRVPAAMDGTEAVQNPIEPGESFTYDFEILDPGTFWYHPHFNSDAQIGYGLYGPIVIDDPKDPLPHDDVVLVLSDVSLDEEGNLSPGDESGWFGDYFGRQGQHLLVNGKILPTLKVRPGLAQRWRLINAARSRFFGLAVPDARMVRVAGDAGFSEHPLDLEELVLYPSERSELLVTARETELSEVIVPLRDVDRFETGLPEADRPLLRLELVEPSHDPAPDPPARLTHFEPFSLEGVAVREIVLGEASTGELTINGMSSSHHVHASQVGYVGDTEIWEVRNETQNHHPFHLHGFSFQVLDVGGVPWPVREWKDTANVPPLSTLRFAVHYDNRPGHWMFHCHILGHAALGMMSVLEIREERE